jgi:hypothetical protein
LRRAKNSILRHASSAQSADRTTEPLACGGEFIERHGTHSRVSRRPSPLFHLLGQRLPHFLADLLRRNAEIMHIGHRLPIRANELVVH